MRGVRMGICDPSIALIMCGIPCKASNSFDKSLNWFWLGNCTNVFQRCNLAMWQNFVTITKILPLAIPNMSPSNCKPFPLPNNIKYIAQYEKLCPSKPHYPTTKTQKKLIYIYCATICLKNGVLTNKLPR
jgi:hypothetical protein